MKKELFAELKESLEEVHEMAKQKTKCEACGFEGPIDAWGCRRCQGMGNYFWMESVRSLAVDVDELIEKRLKEYGITLTEEQEGKIHDRVWKVLEDVSNGYYKNHN